MQPLDRHQITGQNNFHENGLWQHRQRRSRPRRPAPDLHFGNAHLGAFEADPKIAVQCQHHTTGHQGSGHGSDDRLFASAHGFVKRIAHLAQDIDALVPRDLGCFLEVQSGAWSKIRRDKPDYVISWLLAGGHVVASKEMRRNRFPIDRYLSVNWLNEVDIANIGAEEAKGILRGTNVAGGQEVPIVKTMLETYYANGKGSGPESLVRDVYYNTGMAIYSAGFEAARIAITENGWPITPESMKNAYESIENFDGDGVMAPVTVTGEDHGGGGKTRVEQWDGETWVPLTDWSADYLDVVWDVIKESSEKFTVE